MKGTVKWFNEVMGYGFITPDDGSPDIFVHHTQILMDGFKKLDKNQEVEFEIIESERGPKAKNVKPENIKFIGKRKGWVIWFDDSEGLGYISLDTKDGYARVYTSQILMKDHTLKNGQEVEFELIRTEHGFEARRVKVIP